MVSELSVGYSGGMDEEWKRGSMGFFSRHPAFSPFLQPFCEFFLVLSLEIITQKTQFFFLLRFLSTGGPFGSCPCHPPATSKPPPRLSLLMIGHLLLCLCLLGISLTASTMGRTRFRSLILVSRRQWVGVAAQRGPREHIRATSPADFSPQRNGELRPVRYTSLSPCVSHLGRSSLLFLRSFPFVSFRSPFACDLVGC